jgi:hypothetical protein
MPQILFFVFVAKDPALHRLFYHTNNKFNNVDGNGQPITDTMLVHVFQPVSKSRGEIGIAISTSDNHPVSWSNGYDCGF